MAFSSYGRSIDSIAMTKVIAVGRKLVQKENKDYKISLGARTWGNRAQTYAVVFKFWPTQDATWGDMSNVLNGLQEFWHLWNMKERAYTLTKETPEKGWAKDTYIFLRTRHQKHWAQC